ncbi:hypothetical protein [Paraburkholderia sp. GAS199]|uniref:hypothetical protein n=1 Tax=Paraburkholderia sp. GAS199 TaxID=3035126 RepID=UPI003D205E15
MSLADAGAIRKFVEREATPLSERARQFTGLLRFGFGRARRRTCGGSGARFFSQQKLSLLGMGGPVTPPNGAKNLFLTGISMPILNE